MIAYLESPLAQWAASIFVLFGSHFAYLTVRSSLLYVNKKRFGNDQFIKKRLFAFSSIAYIFGLRIASSLAPFHPSTQATVDHVIFSINVFLGCNIAKTLIFLAIESSFFQNIPAPNLKQGFFPLLKNLITLFSFSTAVIMILQHFNYDVFSLVTALGVGSLAFGLASKDTLSHMIAGFILIIDRNLRPGDCIQIDASIGIVKEIGLRSTQIIIVNGNLLIVPNSDLVNNKILNLSYPTPESRGSFFLKVSCATPLESIRDTCKDLYFQIPQVSKQHPTVFLLSFSEGYQLLEVNYWAKDTRDLKKVGSEFQSKLLAWCREKNIALFGT